MCIVSVFTVLPDAPCNLAVTNIQSSSVLLQFEQGFSGHSLITAWIVELQRDRIDSLNVWFWTKTVHDPFASAVVVQGLRPSKSYRLRLIAENVAGRSSPSAPTAWFDTLKAVPAAAPSDVAIRALNETALLVRWMVSRTESGNIFYSQLLTKSAI